MQSSFRAGRSPDRQIVVSFGPRQRTDVEGARFRVEAGPNQRRQTRTVFRITYCTLFAEWSTAIVAVGLLSFYVFAILDTKSGHRDNINYKVRSSELFSLIAGLCIDAFACLAPLSHSSLAVLWSVCMALSHSYLWRTSSCRRTCGCATC